MKKVRLIVLLVVLVTTVGMCTAAMAAETKTVTITLDDFINAGIGEDYQSGSFTTADGLKFEADICNRYGNEVGFSTLNKKKACTTTFTAPNGWQILSIEGNRYTGNTIQSYTEPANLTFSPFKWESLNKTGEASVSFTGGTNGTYDNAGVWGRPFTITLIKMGEEPVPKTGDASLLLPVGLMLVSAAGAVYFTAKARKYN